MRQSRFLEQIFERAAPPRTVSLTINSDLVVKAKEAGLNLSQIAEGAIAEKLTEFWRERIKAEIAEEMKEYEAFIAKHGSFAEAVREFLAERDENADAI